MRVNTFSFEPKALRRRFIAVQAVKGGLGVVLAAMFVGLAGRPDNAESVALGLLLAPGILALLVFTPLHLARLEQAGLIVATTKRRPAPSGKAAIVWRITSQGVGFIVRLNESEVAS